MIKALAKASFPRMYYRLARWKHRGEPLDFSKHYTDTDPTPCPALIALAPRIPSYVDTLFIPGCAPGRDFNACPELKPWGIDIVPFDQIKWCCFPKYEQISLEGWTARLTADLSRVLVFTNGLLMYVPFEWQWKFYDAIHACGCKNMIFHEPPFYDKEYGRHRGHKFFHLDSMDFKLEQHHPILRTWIKLDE